MIIIAKQTRSQELIAHEGRTREFLTYIQKLTNFQKLSCSCTTKPRGGKVVTQITKLQSTKGGEIGVQKQLLNS